VRAVLDGQQLNTKVCHILSLHRRAETGARARVRLARMGATGGATDTTAWRRAARRRVDCCR
jgi:hypothetical protein